MSHETLFGHGLKVNTSWQSHWKKRNSSRKNTRGNYEKVDKTVYNWFIDKRSQEIPKDGVIIKEKALEFAKALGVTEFKASDCWFSNWKKRKIAIFLLILNILTKYFYKVTYFLFLKSLTNKALAFPRHHQD